MSRIWIFAQARYYNTGHGRFTTVDPLTASATIRNPQSFNRYSYASNSPYKFTDPLGLFSSHCNTHRCYQLRGGDWFTSSYGGATPNFSAHTARRQGSDNSSSTGTQPQAQQPENPPAILVQSTELKFTATQVGDNGVVTEIDFTVTTNTYLVCNGCSGLEDLTVETTSTATAKAGTNNNNGELNQSRLDTAASVVAQVVASATALQVPANVALGLAANESFFGIVSGGQLASMSSNINPLKLTPNQMADGTQPMSAQQAGSEKAALKHNVQNALRFFRDEKMGNRPLEQGLFRYGPGNAQDPNYVRDTMQYIRAIGSSSKTTTTNPYILTTVSK